MREEDIIEKVLEVLSLSPTIQERYVAELENFKQRLKSAKQKQTRLGVIGVTSSGKSTMLNALFGESLLPAVARPSSSQLVCCHYANSRRVTIYFENGSNRFFEGKHIRPELISKYGDESYNKKNKEHVKQIELTSPKFPLSQDLVLIDSPGLDAFGYEGHEQLTMRTLLPTIDICVFVTTCKSNSDEKTLSVLNTVADYNKPIIIVQNMIDSLTPSIDGKKSISEVAQEHKRRIERIIDQSNIKDKSSAKIVQISAIKALKVRENGIQSKTDRIKLQQSNYDKLIDTIQYTFQQVFPKLEGNRLNFLKKEINRIADLAIEDGRGANLPIDVFKFEGIKQKFAGKIDKIIEQLYSILDCLSAKLDSLSEMHYFDSSDITEITEDVRKCENVICKKMMELNSDIIKACSELNVDSRYIISDFRFETLDLSLKKKEITRERWVEGERHWYTLWLVKTGGHYEKFKEKVVDVERSIRAAVDYLDHSISIFGKTIERWKKSIDITCVRLYSEIDNRQREYEARKTRALSLQEYLKVGKELKSIADTIPLYQPQMTRTSAGKTDVSNTADIKVRVSKGLYSLFLLSERIRTSIHHSAVMKFCNLKNKNVIVGWDISCELEFLKYAFLLDVKETQIKEGTFPINNLVTVVHKNNVSSQPKVSSNINYFILTNAIQYGSALKQINDSGLKKTLKSNDKLYFVVQDMEEVIKGDCLKETISNMIMINKQLGIPHSADILLMHDNPIYNLAAMEAQSVGCSTQSDEIKMIHLLNDKFGLLFPSKQRAIVNDNIRYIINTIGNRHI